MSDRELPGAPDDVRSLPKPGASLVVVAPEALVEETPAFMLLDELTPNPLPSEVAHNYKRKVASAFDAIQSTSRRCEVLSSKLHSMQREVSGQHEQLKNSGSQAFQDSAMISKSKKQLARTQEQVQGALAKEEATQLERMQLQDQKLEIETHIEEERAAKIQDLEPQIGHFEGVIDELKEQIHHLSSLVKKQETERDATLARIAHLRGGASEAKGKLHDAQVELRRAKGEPEKFRAQADVVLSTLNSFKAEAEKLLDDMRTQDQELLHQEKRRNTGLEETLREATELDTLKTKVSTRARACASVSKDIELERTKHTQLLEDSASRALELQRVQFRITRKKEQTAAKERDANSAAHELQRMQQTLVQLQASIPPLMEESANLERLAGTERSIRDKVRKEIAIAVGERNTTLAGVLERERGTENLQETVSKASTEVDELQSELREAIQMCAKLGHATAELEVEREGKKSSLAKEQEAVQKVKSEVRRRDYQLEDMQRRIDDGENDLQRVETDYERVKGERTKYLNVLRRVQVLSVELSEKTKVLEQEIAVITEECARKEEALRLEEKQLLEVTEERDALRGEYNDARFAARAKELAGEHAVMDIKALNQNIKGLEAEVVMLRSAYEGSLGERNEVALQVVNINEELSLAYQHSNQQIAIQKNGELELQARDQEVNIVQLRLDELDRQLSLYSKSMSFIPKYQDEIGKLQAMLNVERAQAAELASNLEDPERKKWRNLDVGKKTDEANTDDLRAKVVALEGELTKRSKAVAVKSKALDRATAMVEKQRHELETRHGGATQASRQINDVKNRIRGANRKLMATLSELSVHQTTAQRLEHDADELTETLAVAHERLGQNFAPTPQAEAEWARFEKRQNQKEAEQVRISEEQAELEEAALGRTTHYVADDDPFQLPRPFPNYFRPLAPSETAAKRKMRVPVQKPLFDV
jgi:chromosome segregation ATPase